MSTNTLRLNGKQTLSVVRQLKPNYGGEQWKLHFRTYSLSLPFSPAKMQVILCEMNQAGLVSQREGAHLVLNVTFTGLERYMD